MSSHLLRNFPFQKKEGLPYKVIPSGLSLASEFSFPKKEGLPYIVIPSELSLASEFSFPKKEGLPYEVIPSELSLPFPWQVPAKTIYISNTNPGQDWSHAFQSPQLQIPLLTLIYNLAKIIYYIIHNPPHFHFYPKDLLITPHPLHLFTSDQSHFEGF